VIVDVNTPGSHDPAGGVHSYRAVGCIQRTDGNDPITTNPDVTGTSRGTQTINNCATVDD
jgi:hypothetical protein